MIDNYCSHGVHLGESQKWPDCGKLNPSGFNLPKDCIWCKLEDQKPLDPEFSKTVDKHFWELV